MDRKQAAGLWLAVLDLPAVAPGAEGRAQLTPLWDAAGLSEGERERFVPALAEPLEGRRREQVVASARRVIAAAGWRPDLLTTPAAGMRGL